MSVDPETSAAFFTALFGWTELPVEISPFGTYRQLFLGNEIFGGMLPLDPALNYPSHWISYIDVHNIEAVTARARRLGGTIALPPAEIPGIGRFAALTDKQGALFCVIEWNADAARSSVRADKPQPGAVAWNELLSADPSSAAAFYRKLFRWETRTSQDARGEQRQMSLNGRPEAGIRQRVEGMNASAWLVSFAVADLDAALARVVELGGRVVSGPMEGADQGRFAYAADPTEAGFGLVQLVPPTHSSS